MENPSNKDLKAPIHYRVVLASVLALLLAMWQPSMLLSSIVFCVTPMLISALYAWAGWIPAIIASAGTIASVAMSAEVFGVSAPLLVFLAVLVLILPAAANIAALRKKMQFFVRMAISIAAQIGTLLIAMCVIYVGYQVDLIDLMLEMMRETIDQLPYGTIALLLESLNGYGMLTEESIAEISGGILLQSDIVKVLDQVFDTLGYYLKQLLPTMLISSGLVWGLMMNTVSTRIYASCVPQAEIEYITIDEWYVPPRFVGMTIVGTAAGIAMQLSGANGAEAVTQVFMFLMTILFSVQGIAAIHRTFRMASGGRLMKNVMIVLSLLFMPSFLEISGIFSLLFGRRGVITMWMKKRVEERESEDDDE